MVRFVPSRTGFMVLGNLQIVDIRILNPVSCKYDFFRMICAARKLEKVLKNDFVIKFCIFTSINNENVVLFIIVYLGY